MGASKGTHTSACPQKMRLTLAQYFASLIRRAGKGAWLFSCDISRVYQQLPLDAADWPLVCFKEGDVSSWMPVSIRPQVGSGVLQR